jgi:cell wall-associated NlpC family hydrolase
MIDPEMIVREARKLIGTPFVHQGRAPGAGIDCGGLVVVVADVCGYESKDVPPYSGQPESVDTEAALAEFCDEIHVDAAEPGDVVTFLGSNYGSKKATHMAILSDRGMIHAWDTARRTIEHAVTKGWQARIHKAFRMREHGDNRSSRSG